MVRILAFSDSHGSLAEMDEVLQTQEHDLAVHMGDHMITAAAMSQRFDYWVGGNNDTEGPESVVFTIEGVTFFLIHGHRFFSFTYKAWLDKMEKEGIKKGAQVVLFGHSHFPDRWDGQGVVIANPGSISDPRPSFCLNPSLRQLSGKRTYLLITVDKTELSFAFMTH